MQRHTFGQAPYKYHFVFWGLICLPLPLLIASRGRPFTWAPDALSRDPAVSTVVSADVRRSSLKWRMAAAVTFSIAALIGAVVLQDRPLRAGAALWHYAPYWLAPPLVAASAILILRSEAATRVILLSLLLVCVGLQTGMCIYQVQQPYSTTYNYGQEGITAAAAYIRSITRPTDIVFCMKDIGPLCQRRFYESYDYMYRGPDFTRRGIEVLTKYVNVAVFTEGLGEDQLFINPEMQCWVANHCTLLRNIGNYRIYAVRR
jgi:hypothetical protein